VLCVWFPGQEFGDALADVLFGDVDPGGRLPVTLPRRLEDSPAFEHAPGRNGVGRYLEGRLVGYRFYDTVGREPLFPFGYGLSYAHVSIDSAAFDGGVVRVSLTNTSDRVGVEVVQVYAHDPEGTGATDDPAQALVGFAKVALAAGESQSVEIPLNPRWSMHWDIATHAWATHSGARELRVGRSSRDIAHVVTTHV
jgi:beta-glucosidase